MSTTFRPLLAVDATAAAVEAHLRDGPMLASPKIDGIRALVLQGRLLSRNLKPIPNGFVNAALHAGREFASHLEGLDGELVVGDPFGEGVFRRTSSGVTAREGEPDFGWLVFDRAVTGPYSARRAEVDWLRGECGVDRVRVVPQVEFSTPAELDALEGRWLLEGYEGAMVRRADAPYKYGRSTLREGFLLKVKRHADREGTVVGFYERLHNENPATVDALGRTVRSTVAANRVGMGTLGGLLVRCDDVPEWKEFGVGTGFTDAERREVWGSRERYLGRSVRFKYVPVGTADAPRFPVFLGWRHPIDG